MMISSSSMSDTAAAASLLLAVLSLLAVISLFAVTLLPVVASSLPPLIVLTAAAAFEEDETGIEKVMMPPSPSAAPIDLACASNARTISRVVASRFCSAFVEVDVGRMVARCCLTVAGESLPCVFCVVFCGVEVVCCELSCESAFLEVLGVGVGKMASQIAVYGGWPSVEGRVRRGVSQREKGEGGS